MKKVLIGFVFGLAVCLLPSLILSRTPTPLETSIAQVLYENVNPYNCDINLNRVLFLVKDFSDQKLPLKNKSELYQPIMSYKECKTEQELRSILLNEEKLLKSIMCKPQIRTIVPDRVLIEVIKEGSGKEVCEEDVVRLHFKEYSSDGVLLKDSQKPYTIPLSQTIKGFRLGLTGAKVGETRKIYIHPEFGFGKMGRKSPNRLLIYEVTIINE